MDLFLKLIAIAEGIIIIVLIVIIIQKAKYDLNAEKYEDFDATIYYKLIDEERNKKRYNVCVKYDYGSITINDKNLYEGFDRGERVILRVKAIKNENEDIIKINKKNVLVIRKKNS